VNDGIDYKKLCQDLNKYVNAQKKCVQEVTASQKRTFVTKQWKDIIQGLVQTYNAKNIKKICYYEGDQETTKKKHVLNIHDVFRKFCIEKKTRLQNLSDMDFEQCNEYLSWINGKKMYLQGLDPNYEYIKEYQEYFDIRDNCNYPWLLKKTPDITCRMTTRTKAKEKDKKSKTLNSPSQSAPAVTTVSSTEVNKDTSSKAISPSKAKLDPPTSKSSNTDQGKVSAKDTTSGDGNFDPQSSISNVMVQGAPIQQPIPIFKPTPASKIPKLKSIFQTLSTNLDGNKITDVVRHLFRRKPITNANKYPNDVKGYPIKHNITNSYNFIPTKILHSKPFIKVLLSEKIPSSNNRLQSFKEPFTPPQPLLPTIVNSQPYVTTIPITVKRARKTKPIKIQETFFSKLSPFPEITSGTQQNEIVFIEPAIPDASYFRSPSMIYTLVFLTFFTIITIFYLLSKYTPLRLLFSKKKKKKRLKRQFEIKKIPEESPIFDKVTNYSVSDMPYENKTHDDNNIYSKIKIQKGVINKNISLPKKKKNKRKALIDIHMELLNEYKNDEWKLKKNDFLEICLEQIQKKIKCFSGITFKNLQYEWKEEENAYFDKIEEQNSSLNENEKISYIEIKKDIWRRWITKQTKLIELYKEEQWFKSLVEELENVSDEYKKGKITDDIFVENIKELENKENSEELYKLNKHIFQIKVLIQILMMVIEECIKEENPEQTEVLLDKLINKLNKEKRAKIEPEKICEENMNHI
ncbi:STP1 protein, partial [Plasmodium ovale curtisi]